MIQMSNGNCFICDECPICEDLERRMTLAEAYNHEPLLEYCCCDKVGTKFVLGGKCSDGYAKPEKKRKHGKRKTGRAYRSRMAHIKKMRLMKAVEHEYNRSIITNWEFTDDFRWLYDYIKYPKNSKRRGYWKGYSNRKVRRFKGELGNGNKYRRLFDYWWELD